MIQIESNSKILILELVVVKALIIWSKMDSFSPTMIEFFTNCVRRYVHNMQQNGLFSQTNSRQYWKVNGFWEWVWKILPSCKDRLRFIKRKSCNIFGGNTRVGMIQTSFTERNDKLQRVWAYDHLTSSISTKLTERKDRKDYLFGTTQDPHYFLGKHEILMW